MKGFIRSLSIEERKTYVSAISYTFFQSISCVLVKMMISWYKIRSLTLICEGGSIISIMCICQVIISIRKKKTKIEELLENTKNKWFLISALVNSISLFFAIFAIAYTSISTYSLILNQSSILTIFLANYFFKQKIQKEKTKWYILLTIASVVIIIPLFGKSFEDFLGILFSLSAMATLSISHLVNRKTSSSQIDVLILFIGIYSAAFGCFSIMMFTNEIGELGFLYWMLILLKSFFTYYMVLFQIKAVRNLNNTDKLIPFNFFSILFSLITGFFLFDQILFVNDYIGYGLTLIFIYVVSTKILRPCKMNKFLDKSDYTDYYEYN